MRLPNPLASRSGRLAAFFALYLTEGIPLGFTATAIATQMRRRGIGFLLTLVLCVVRFLMPGQPVDLGVGVRGSAFTRADGLASKSACTRAPAIPSAAAYVRHARPSKREMPFRVPNQMAP
jgi:hypothetical protein